MMGSESGGFSGIMPLLRRMSFLKMVQYCHFVNVAM